MDKRTKEYVESAKEADELAEKVETLCEVIGLDGVGEFGARYIQSEIVNNGTLDYTVYPVSSGKSDYCVIDEIDNRSDTGKTGSISPGPIARLRRNGFIVRDACAYTGGACPRMLRDYRGELPDNFAAAYVSYVGAEHPIIEYWDDEESE
jgi:hypothetical protein